MGIVGKPEKGGELATSWSICRVTALQALWIYPESLGPGQMLTEVDPNRLPGTPGHV